MSSAEMWWAGDALWMDGTTGLTETFRPEGLALRGLVTNNPLQAARTTYVQLHRHFFLDRSRMPVEDFFLSIPTITVTGGINALAMGPLAECSLQLKQTGAPGGHDAVTSLGPKKSLVRADFDSLVRAALPITLPFPSIVFVLDKTQDLYIDLDIILWFNLIGESQVRFTVPADAPYGLTLAAPQWSIVSAPPIL